MAVIFIFEDDKDSPISKLLCCGFNGNNIYFSSGAENLYIKYDSLVSSGVITSKDFTFIFIDYIPNNIVTIDRYKY